QVLVKHHQDGKGGILLSELSECISQAENILESLGSKVLVLPTEKNNKAIFWNDPTPSCYSNSDLKSLWREVSLDHLDEEKIAIHSFYSGIAPMNVPSQKKNMDEPSTSRATRRNTTARVQNDHLDDVLEEY
ncbi:hypothetical protein PENTCL1PPCAC_21391, partial [Pristionchus entomophagus]